MEDLDREIANSARKLPFASQTEAAEDMAADSAQLTEMLRQRSELDDLRGRLEAGEAPVLDYRAHLNNPAVPLPPPAETGYILTFWSVVSVPLILLSIAAILVFESVTVAGFTAIVAVGVTLAEQLARRRYQAFVRLAVIFAVVGAFFAFAVGGAFTVGRFGLGAVMAAAAAVLFISNLGELGAAARHRRRTAQQQQIEEEATAP